MDMTIYANALLGIVENTGLKIKTSKERDALYDHVPALGIEIKHRKGLCCLSSSDKAVAHDRTNLYNCVY